MRNSNLTAKSSKLSLIAWILIGLMVGGSLVNYLAASEQSGLCSELRVLELEDDRVDVLDVAYVPASGHYWTCSIALPGDIPLSHCPDTWIAVHATKRDRGPPLIFS